MRCTRAGRPLGLLLATLIGCQSASPTRPADKTFPTPSELEELPAPLPAQRLLETDVDDVDEWTLSGPFPERVEDSLHAPANPWEALLGDAVGRRPGLAVSTEAMHCTAREVGLFLLQRGKLPPRTLLEFTAARCGVVGEDFRPAWFQGMVPSNVSDEEVLEQWRPQIEELVQHSMGGGAVAAGLWFGRSEGRAVVSIASTVRHVLVTPFSPVAAGGRVSFQGEALASVQEVSGYANQGRLGYAECIADTAVRLPKFSLSCPVSASDPFAIVEVSTRAPGRILSDGALRVLARRPGDDGRRWRRVQHAPSRPATSERDFARGVFESLALVRSDAELHALVLSEAQSEQASALLPHMVAGSIGLSSPALADMAALGLAAGWRVGGAVKDAAIATDSVAGSIDAGRWLDAALERPLGRAALLDPDARVLAVAALTSAQPPAVVAVAATYALFGEEDFRADAALLLQRIATARAAQGKSPAVALAAVQPLIDETARDLPAHHRDPQIALQEALGRATAAAGRSLHGWVLEGRDAGVLPLPGELTDWDELSLAVAVGYYQPADEPWGRTVAFLIATPPDVGI